MRAAVLLDEKTRDRAVLLEALARRAPPPAMRATPFAARSSRRCCTGTARELVEALDETLLGLRPRPASLLRVA